MSLAGLYILVVGLGMLVALALVTAARATHSRHAIAGTDDVETAYVTVLGTFYAIFLAFMIFVVWSRFYEAYQVVDQEANAAADLYTLSDGLPEPYGSRLRQLTADYVRTAVEHEWPAMATGRPAEPTRQAVARMWSTFGDMNQRTVPDFVLRDHLLERFTQLTDLRRSRLLDARVRLPGVLYAALFFGAAVTLLLASLFTVKDPWPHALKAVAVAALLAFMLLTIWLLDHPFSGLVTVPPTAL